MKFTENKQSDFRTKLQKLLNELARRMNGVGPVSCVEVSRTEYFIEVHNMRTMYHDSFTVYEQDGIANWCNGRIKRQPLRVLN
ncbi:MAG: hypothetical protein ACRC3J_05185 [Culicoidibacterales bacterium]